MKLRQIFRQRFGGEPLYRWKLPKRVRDAEQREAWKTLRPTIYRIPAIILTVVFVFYGLVRLHLPEVDFPLGEALGLVLFFSLMIAGEGWLLQRYVPIEYSLNNNSISRYGRLVRWKHVQQATIQPHPLVEGIRIIKLRITASHRAIVITLPEDNSAEEIYRAIREKVPTWVTPNEFIEPDQLRELTGGEYVLMFTTVTLYEYGVGHLTRELLIGGKFTQVVFFGLVYLTLLLGPGTIGCLLMAPLRKYRWKELMFIAGIFNYLAVLLTMVVVAGVIYSAVFFHPHH